MTGRDPGVPGTDKEGRITLGKGILPIALAGGAVTAMEPTLLELGRFSMIMNLRPTHPGFKKRGGLSALHTTADGTNQVMNLYQFSKGKQSELHLLAQMSDGDVLKATNNPPAETSGAFGTEIYSGSSGQSPASWAVIKDMMIHSNGADQHQIWPGENSFVTRFVKTQSDAALPFIVEKGQEYTRQVTDGSSSTGASLNSLGDLATDYDCIFIMCPVKAKQFTLTVPTPNTAAAVLKMNYFNGAWTAVAITDGTTASGKTLAQDGSITWTPPSDEKARYLFGQVGYWYQIYLDSGGALSASVLVSSVKFEANWQSIENLWDGNPKDIIEFQLYKNTADAYFIYPSAGVDLSGMTSSDKGYFSSYDNLVGIFVDVAGTPNVTGSTTVSDVKVWTGAAFESVSNLNDGTDGFSKSGWITWDLKSTAQRSQFNDLPYQAYWFYLTVDQTLSEDILFKVACMPHFDIGDFGSAGVCCGVWKDRAVYSFGDNKIYISAGGQPMVLNGDDFEDPNRIYAGDGRSNQVLCMKKFWNELLVWQEEKGPEGGCLTLYQGYMPGQFGKYVISTREGILNAKCAVVINGSDFSASTLEPSQVIAVWLSHYGVFVTNGKTVVDITGDIQNYFDPKKSECIRRGYENQMWLAWDSADKVVRLGLVSGADATVCNVFPIYDFKSEGWFFDDPAQPLACMTEVEAGSGQAPILQVGGGTADGTVYMLNTGDDDNGTAIDAYFTVELDYRGMVLLLTRVWLRAKSQDGAKGNITITPYTNGIAWEREPAAIEHVQTRDNELSRRDGKRLSQKGTHISLKVQHYKRGESVHFLNLGLELYALQERRE